MKKIIIIHEDGRVTGGSAKIAIETAIGLADKGYDVTYFCGTAPVDVQLTKSVNRVVCLKQKDIASDSSRLRAVKNGIWNKDAYRFLSKLFEEYGNDVIVHIHGWSHILSASIFKACSDCGIVPFVTLHDYFSVCPNGGFYNFQKKHICKYKPMSAKCVFCNCDSKNYYNKLFRVVRQFVQDKYIKKNKNIRYIYISKFSLSKIEDFVESKDFYFLHNPIDRYDIQRVNAQDNKMFIYIGRISPEKGVEVFCEAASQLGVSTTIIGNGSLLSELKENYKNINFTGWMPKDSIVPFIKETHCLVFPSKCYETDGLVVQECLGVGIPCIVAKECAASDYIDNGVNGYVFKSEDVEDLKKKMLSIEKIDWDKFLINNNTLDDYLQNILRIYFE